MAARGSGYLPPQSREKSEGCARGLLAARRVGTAANVRRLRRPAARVFSQCRQHGARRAHARVGPVQQPARPDQGAAAPDHRDDQGAPGKRTDQQSRLRPAGQRARRPAHFYADGRAHAGRPRRTADESVEGTGLFPRAPAGDCRFWARMHAPRRAATDRQPVRFAVFDLARRAAGAVRQTAHRRRQDENYFAARGRAAPGRDRPVPAWPGG